MGTGVNGNFQGGLGAHIWTSKAAYLDAEYRLHHISNAGTEKPNDALNSSRFLLGLTLFH